MLVRFVRRVELGWISWGSSTKRQAASRRGCDRVSFKRGLEAATATRYKPARVNNRPSDVIAPRDTSVAFKWLLSRLCLDADVDLWNSIKLHGIPYRPNRVVVLGTSTPFHLFHPLSHHSLAILVLKLFQSTISSFFPCDELSVTTFVTRKGELQSLFQVGSLGFSNTVSES